jgi:aryl-alcohol dehydrogenase-like predicted oxidoreductase
MGDPLERRRILGMLAGATLAAAPSADAQTASGGMIYRAFGRTGEFVSAIGLGGFHIGVQRYEHESIRIIRAAVDQGITFLDNCWDYHDGGSEIRMGKALRDGYRKRVFLMTKFDGRTRQSAARQMDQSLQRLQTDHVDLMQYHENIRMEDPDRFFAAGGPLEALLDAKKAGKIRFIGFTGHKDPAVHLRMLDVAQQHDFHFDAAQMPLNLLDANFRSFAKLVVPRLLAQGIAVLGMKPMASANLPKSGLVTGIECLHYALNLPTSTVITGCDSMERLQQALEAARTFKPLSDAQLNALLARTKAAALTGKLEPFKTTSEFDGTAHNVRWMG